MSEEGNDLILTLGSGDDGDSESEDVFKLFVCCLRENGMLLHTQGIVTHLISGVWIDTAEVLGARKGDIGAVQGSLGTCEGSV